MRLHFLSPLLFILEFLFNAEVDHKRPVGGGERNSAHPMSHTGC